MAEEMKKETEEAQVVPAQDQKAPDAKPEQHDDEQQDIALFKKLLKQHLGDQHEENEEAMHMAKKIHAACKGKGMEDEEAMKCAGYGIKAAALLGETDEAETREAEEKKVHEAEETEEKKVHEAEEVEAEESEEAEEKKVKESEEAEEKKESEEKMPPDGGKVGIKKMEAALVKLTAENAALKEAAKRLEIDGHLEKILRESGLPVAATKAFRVLVKDKKNVKEIDEAFSAYREAFKATAGRAKVIESFAFASEKTVAEKPSTSKVGGFGDCIN